MASVDVPFNSRDVLRVRIPFWASGLMGRSMPTMESCYIDHLLPSVDPSFAQQKPRI